MLWTGDEVGRVIPVSEWVEQDVESANDSGVAGTPTFFIKGRRHEGAYDLESLRAAIGREARSVRAAPIAADRERGED